MRFEPGANSFYVHFSYFESKIIAWLIASVDCEKHVFIEKMAFVESKKSLQGMRIIFRLCLVSNGAKETEKLVMVDKNIRQEYNFSFLASSTAPRKWVVVFGRLCSKHWLHKHFQQWTKSVKFHIAHETDLNRLYCLSVIFRQRKLFFGDKSNWLPKPEPPTTL